MWPVTLQYDGGAWMTWTNGYREWSWDGKEPLNLRLARFISNIKLYQFYNMSFAAQPPSDMRFQIQRRTVAGNNSEWAAFRIYYPVPNSISVLVNNSVVIPILATSSESILNRTSTCGANKFFYSNNTIQFVVTGAANCQVRVKLTSSVQITARLATDINSFYSNGGVATFIDKICAFLSISTDRLKIVGVTSGSVIIDFLVASSINTTTDNSTADSQSSAAVVADLQKISDLMTGSASTADMGSLGQIFSTTTKITIMNSDGTPVVASTSNGQLSSNTTTIIIAVVVSVLSVTLIGVTAYLVVKKLRNREAIEPE